MSFVKDHFTVYVDATVCIKSGMSIEILSLIPIPYTFQHKEVLKIAIDIIPLEGYNDERYFLHLA